jgi:serine/threonine protein kinase
MICDKCDRENRDDANFCDNCGESLSRVAEVDSPARVSTPPGASLPKIDESVTEEQLSRILGGRYELKEMLGRGGMGVVYRAYDQQLGMEIAIKFLLDRFVNDIGAVASLKREARAAMQLAHPNIVRLYNFEDTPEAKYLLMEYIAGESLSSVASRKPKGCFSEQEVKEYIPQICAALDCAHGKGIIHRDIKPSNILITHDGHIKLADFGIAHFKETASSQVGLGGGTPIYMSPEQIVEIPLDGRTDIYSLGITMYQMLAGAPPFTGDDVRHCHLHVTPKPIKSASDWMNTVIMKCLRKEPDGRWLNAEELGEVLKGKRQIGVTMSGVYQPEWQRAQMREEQARPKAPPPRTPTSETTKPERRQPAVVKTPPAHPSGVRERVGRIEKRSAGAPVARATESDGAFFGMMAGIAAGAIMIAIHRGSPWSISEELLFQFSWIMYGALLGIAVGLAQRQMLKGMLSLALGLLGGGAAVILLKSLAGVAALESFGPTYYSVPCAAIVGAFLGIAGGIYKRSFQYSMRRLLWGVIGGVLAASVFLGLRRLLGEYWSPFLDWLTIGGALGFFLNICLGLAKKPLEEDQQGALRPAA